MRPVVTDDESSLGSNVDPRFLDAEASWQPRQIGTRELSIIGEGPSHYERGEPSHAYRPEEPIRRVRHGTALFFGLISPEEHVYTLYSSKILQLAWCWEIFILAVVLVDLVLDALVSIPNIDIEIGPGTHAFEVGIVALFATEYLAQVWCCPEILQVHQLGAFRGRLKFMAEPFMLVDLLITVVTGLDLWISANLFHGISELRLVSSFVRFTKVAYVFRMERQFGAFFCIGRVVSTKGRELIAALLVAIVGMVLAANLIYCVELGKNEEFSSLVQCVWWAIETLSTVGYGDIVPNTAGGYIISSVTAFMGVVLLSLIAGIFSSGFTQIREDVKAAQGVGVAVPGEDVGGAQFARKFARPQVKERLKDMQERRGKEQERALVRMASGGRWDSAVGGSLPLELSSAVRLDSFRRSSGSRLPTLEDPVLLALSAEDTSCRRLEALESKMGAMSQDLDKLLVESASAARFQRDLLAQLTLLT